MLTRFNSLAIVLAVGLLLVTLVPVVAHATDCCDPASPFREGEGLANMPATCSDIAKWAQLAPKTNDRITMSIRGRLSKVETSSALVYLTMCDEGQLQVFCVTYQANGMRAGDTVLFAGGYERSATGQVVLDPCLASRE